MISLAWAWPQRGGAASLLRAQPIRWSLQMPLVSAIDHPPFPCGHLVWLPDAPMPANQPTIEKVPVPCDRCHGTPRAIVDLPTDDPADIILIGGLGANATIELCTS
jgi:hypothetical protein